MVGGLAPSGAAPPPSAGPSPTTLQQKQCLTRPAQKACEKGRLGTGKGRSSGATQREGEDGRWWDGASPVCGALAHYATAKPMPHHKSREKRRAGRGWGEVLAPRRRNERMGVLFLQPDRCRACGRASARPQGLKCLKLKHFKELRATMCLGMLWPSGLRVWWFDGLRAIFSVGSHGPAALGR